MCFSLAFLFCFVFLYAKAPRNSSKRSPSQQNRTLQSTHLFDRLARIEELLRSRGVSGASSSSQLASSLVSYVDTRDETFTLLGERPEVVNVNDVTPRHFIVYRFGLHVLDLLGKLNRHNPVNLLLARTLPAVSDALHNNYRNNAFGRSFFFEQATNTLFVRMERIESVGDFVLLLAHCSAHLSVGHMDNDADPAFMGQFYRSLRCCLDDMFAARNSNSRELESALATTKDEALKGSKVQAALTLTRRSSDARIDTDAVMGRLDAGTREFAERMKALDLEFQAQFPSLGDRR